MDLERYGSFDKWCCVKLLRPTVKPEEPRGAVLLALSRLIARECGDGGGSRGQSVVSRPPLVAADPIASPGMEFEDVLSVLLGWMGREIEVGNHGANGAKPVAALEARVPAPGRDFDDDAARRGSFAFFLNDAAGDQVAAFRLYQSSYSGGGWLTTSKKFWRSAAG